MGLGIKLDSLRTGINIIDVPRGKGQNCSRFSACISCATALGDILVWFCTAAIATVQLAGNKTTPPPDTLRLEIWAKLYLGESSWVTRAGYKRRSFGPWRLNSQWDISPSHEGNISTDSNLPGLLVRRRHQTMPVRLQHNAGHNAFLWLLFSAQQKQSNLISSRDKHSTLCLLWLFSFANLRKGYLGFGQAELALVLTFPCSESSLPIRAISVFECEITAAVWMK